MTGRRKISVVIPTLNEAANIDRVYERVTAVFASTLADYDLEMVLTDNHSDDTTFELISEIAARDPRVRAFRFARNFGYQRSILAGYLLATGDAIVQLDADLQDPPELVAELVQRWNEGAKVVYGVRVARQGESRILTSARRGFYRLIDWLSDEELPRDAGDFRLVDRAVVELLRSNNDASPYLRGSIASMGFDQVGIEYERDDREFGETKFSFSSLTRLAVDGILNHSTRPLQLASITAMVVIAIAILGIVVYGAARIAFGQDWPAGFASLALLQLVGILLNAAFLGIIGAYLGRIYQQTRSSPLVIIEATTTEHESPVVLSTSQPVRLLDLRAPISDVTSDG